VKPVELLVIGAGSRGNSYSRYTQAYPERARVVGLAEPRDHYRERLVREYEIAPERVFTDWRQAVELPKFADAVIITTQDAQHMEPAVAFAQKGYDILLEKPMAPDVESCRTIVETAEAVGDIIFAVCHVMRYTPYTKQVKKLVDAGVIGDIVSIQHLEPVGYWHHAHSFTRGNWRNEAESSFMLLAKSCHDIDWLRHIIGRPCVQVSSFGSLKQFRKESKPDEAGEAKRCLDCAYEEQCAFSAKRFYLKALRAKKFSWPLDVITTDLSEEGVINALRNGPYGRCVYECDNDVVDHQVVNLLYENGATAVFTMIAQTEQRDRETIIFGTKGELRGNGREIVVYDFLTEQKTTYEPYKELEEEAKKANKNPHGGHGGGDFGIMDHFIEAVAQRDPSLVLSGPQETLESHLTVFAAEQARRENRIVAVKELYA
jgi:predicted dehydrogenase